MRRALAALLFAAAPSGCAGSSAPTVEIIQASPEVLSASDDARDDLTITVRYFDPDGDLGQGTARIVDCRAEGLVTLLPIPRIAGDEAVGRVPIQGEISLVVSDIGVSPASGAVPPACAELGVEAATEGAGAFCVVLVDAAGHESDAACTKTIAVEP